MKEVCLIYKLWLKVNSIGVFNLFVVDLFVSSNMIFVCS